MKKLSTPVLFQYRKFLLEGLLIFVEIFLVANNWDAVYYAGIPAWIVLLPVSVFLAVENAIKFWGVKRFSEKIAFYAMDVAGLLVLTIFSNGLLISTLYMIILSDFYVEQKDMRSNVVMGASCMGILLITFAVSNSLKGMEVNVITLVSNMLNDLLVMLLHFFILNFSIQIYRKNEEIARTLEELNATNEKLRLANRELQEVAVIEERQRIAKDIHDTAGHSLTTVIMQTEAAKLVVESDPEDAKRKIAAANLQARHALEELRESVHLLSGVQERGSLRDALLSTIHDTCDGTEIVIRYDIDDIVLCDAKRRFVLNSFKEGITNGLRHGGATAFWFELKDRGKTIDFLLTDNGSGRKLTAFKEGFGLGGMRTRAESLGGELWFETEPDEGFEIHMKLPPDGDRER